MSSVNNYRDTTDADILNKLRQDIESARAGSTSQNNFTLNYILPCADTIDITDTVSTTSQNTGTFLIDTAQIDFSDIG